MDRKMEEGNMEKRKEKGFREEWKKLGRSINFISNIIW
jgi:hypothetical protein